MTYSGPANYESKLIFNKLKLSDLEEHISRQLLKPDAKFWSCRPKSCCGRFAPWWFVKYSLSRNSLLESDSCWATFCKTKAITYSPALPSRPFSVKFSAEGYRFLRRISWIYSI